MKRPTLARGLLFALFGALIAIPWQLACAPLVGWDHAFGALMAALTVGALLWNGPSLRAGLGAALLAALLLGPLALLGLAPFPALLAALCVLGVARSAFHGESGRPFARVLAIELGLGLGAGALSSVLYEPRLFEGALAVWGFWLMQSAYPLLGGEPRARAAGDDFERARDAADALLRAPP